MEQTIFGIQINGSSYSITRLEISDNQKPYDYICNFLLEENQRGNGSFRISFTNAEGMSGLPIGKWRILTGRLGFDWGCSVASLIIEDESGQPTEKITAGSDKGSAGGWDEEQLLHSIITKAQEIVEKYPSARIYNFHQALTQSKPAKSGLLKYRDTYDPELLIDIFEKNTIAELADYLKHYRRFESLLKTSEDIRSQRLLNAAREECIKVIELFR